MNTKKILFAITICTLFAFQAFSQKQFKVFLFTKTDGFHHESINGGVDGIKKLAERHNFTVIWNEDERRFNDNFLKDIDVVIFLNTTEDVLNDEQQGVFEKFIQSGKGYVGIHSASDTEYDWPWYNELVGKMFKIHPAQQTAMLDVANYNFPGMEVFPKRFMWTDEWYEFKKEEYSKDLNVLLTLDETSYKPYAKWGDNIGEGMGYHPISWYHDFDGGRSFYTGLGHINAVYDEPWFLQHLYGGIYWAATGKGIKK